MNPAEPTRLRSGDLSFFPERGEVRNSRGETVRLGPVNMKVLSLLVSRPDQVVSRREILDTVWRNQVVSDDALTRCISDIRAELAKLAGARDLIATVPKRGYRWTDGSAVAPVPAAALKSRAPALWRLAGRGVIYLVAFVLLASASVWSIDRLVRPRRPIVAVLPMQGDAAAADVSAGLQDAILAYLIGLDSIDILSRAAVESRPDNPFPYFYYQFGARWLIETESRATDSVLTLRVALVDAQTGIVLVQETASQPRGQVPEPELVEHLLAGVATYIRSD